MSAHDLITDLESHLCQLEPVSLTETSKSWLFLTPDHVFKLKKRVRDDLQDLTSLRARHDNTLTEIDLNRRLAPELYLGAVRVGRARDGRIVLDDPGVKTVDWLVKMRRLPQDRMLDVRIKAGACKEDLSAAMTALISKLSVFFRNAGATRLTADELLSVQRDQLGMARDVMLHPRFSDHHARVKSVLGRIDALWPRLTVMLSEQAGMGAIVEGHGDLRPEHICLTDPPVIYDCLEFNRTLRLGDPYSEIVFLGMESGVLGADWIAPALIEGFENSLGLKPQSELLSMYEALHAVMRARLCFAHLLPAVPRTPKKWIPLGLTYLSIADRVLSEVES